MKDKRIALNLRTSEEFKLKLTKAAEILDIPASQIVREAVNEKIGRIAKRNKRLADALGTEAA